MPATKPSLTPLRDTVQRVLDAGRLGKPAAVRWLVRHAGGGAAATREVQRAEEAVSAWFGGRPSKRHVAGSEGSGHIVVMLSWPSGQTALLTVARDIQRADDLVVLGARGALYYQTSLLNGQLEDTGEAR